MKNFYYLSDADKFPNVEWAEEKMKLESVTCPLNDGHRRPGERRQDLVITLKSPKIGDFIWTWYSECIITSRVANLFSKAGFTGYELKPAVVEKIQRQNKGKKTVPPLWELFVTGRGGMAHEKSGIKLKYECKSCGLKRYTDFGDGLFIDESQWDGSDFFTVWPLPRFVIVTEKVKDFIEEHKFSNCKLTPTKDLVGEGEKGGLGPGDYDLWKKGLWR